MKRTINLVKAAKNPVRVRRQTDRLYNVLNIIVAVMLIAVAITTLSMNISINANRDKIGSQNTQIAVLERQIAGQAEYKSTYQFLKKYNADMTSVLDIIKLSPAVSENVFTSIEESKLQGISLSSFRIDSGTVYISAHSINSNDLILYVEKLRECEVFSVVAWKSSIRFDENFYIVDLILVIGEVRS